MWSQTGPFDLAKQTGMIRGGPEHEAAIQRILKAAKSAGKRAAIFCTLCPALLYGLTSRLYNGSRDIKLILIGTDGLQARTRTQQGFDMVSVTTDVGVLGTGMLRELDLAAERAIDEKQQSSNHY